MIAGSFLINLKLSHQTFLGENIFKHFTFRNIKLRELIYSFKKYILSTYTKLHERKEDTP